jgi:hypothetical protein
MTSLSVLPPLLIALILGSLGLVFAENLALGRQLFETSNGMQFAEYRVAMVNGFKPTVCIGTAGSRTGRISHHSLSRKELARGYA